MKLSRAKFNGVGFVKERAVAVEAALAGGEVLKRYLGGRLHISEKGELDLVTEADTASEETILSLLEKRLPGTSVLAEESGETRRDANQRFIVDPLDGTTNFAHGYPCFAVSIAYEKEGLIRAAVVYDPLREELFVAEEGAGAFVNGKKLQVSQTRHLDKALLVTGFPYDLRQDVKASLRLFNRFMGEARAIRRDGSAALDLCYVAAGRYDGFWEEKLSPWDTAAGSLLVTEAGGQVSDFSGGPFNCRGAALLSTNGLVHPAMLRILEE